jgi:hypothetical protein
LTELLLDGIISDEDISFKEIENAKTAFASG